MIKTNFFLIFVFLFMATSSWAQQEAAPPPNPQNDLVVPSENSSGQNDLAMPVTDSSTKSQSTRTNDVSAKDAQKREKPPEDAGDHYTLSPNYDDEEPKLTKKNRKGDYIYSVTPSPQTRSAGFHIGPYSPANLQGDVPGITFLNIYPLAKPLLIGLDYEWQLFKNVGKFGIKTGFGFFSASGNGRFKSNTNTQADETVNLYAFPLSLSGVYHLQFWDTQVLVPFGEAGGDYIAFLEQRPDKEKFLESIKRGGAPAWHWAAGLQIQLDGLDREGLWQVDQEYGINHIYLVGDMRQIVGLDSTFDFSAIIYEGGILFEF